MMRTSIDPILDKISSLGLEFDRESAGSWRERTVMKKWGKPGGRR
jgi:hypothetical protein